MRKLFLTVLLCAGILPAAARAWDPTKPLIYRMWLAFEHQGWVNMYSTATVLSKSDNSVAFRVVAGSTVNPTAYQLVVTTQGNVGIGTANPSTALDVNGTVTATAFSGSGASLSGITASQVGAVASDGTVNPVNLLSNGNFESWSAGTSAAPDGWTSGGSGSVTREGTTVALGTYSLNLSKTSNNFSYVYQDILAAKGATYWKGKTVTFGCWAYSAYPAATVWLRINDGVNDTQSSTHPGDSQWHWLTVTATISASPASLWIYPMIQGEITSSACFDGCMAVEGSSAFAYSDKPDNNHYGCSVNFTSADVLLTAGQITIIPYNNVLYDRASEYDATTNHRYTASTAGYYQVNTACLLTPTDSTSVVLVYLYKNNAALYKLDYNANVLANKYQHLQGSAIVYLAAGDYIDIRVEQDSGTARSITTADGGYTWLMVQKLSN